MLALLIKVVREMVFTLGKWSFSNKPYAYLLLESGQQPKAWAASPKVEFTAYLSLRGQQEVCLLNLLQGLLQDLIENYTSPVCARPKGTREKRVSCGRGVKHWAETVQRLWHLLKRRTWRVTTITNFEQCEWLFWTFSSVALSNMKSMIYELDSFI